MNDKSALKPPFLIIVRRTENPKKPIPSEIVENEQDAKNRVIFRNCFAREHKTGAVWEYVELPQGTQILEIDKRKM